MSKPCNPIPCSEWKEVRLEGRVWSAEEMEQFYAEHPEGIFGISAEPKQQ